MSSAEITENGQLTVVKQLFSALSNELKNAFTEWIGKTVDQRIALSLTYSFAPVSDQNISRYLQGQKYENGRPDVCPFCGETHVVKNGTKGDAQRYLCRNCGKTFGDTQDSILKSTKKVLAVWEKFVECMINAFSLRKIAEICGISVVTAFIWRHKILDALQNMMAEVKLNGVVEADETYARISYKGQRTDNMPRESYKRGTAANKRGLSREQVCIPCGVNLNGQSIAKVSNLGHPSFQDLNNVLGGKVASGSVLVTDSLRGYHRLSTEGGLFHIQIEPGHYTNGNFNIQMINNFHGKIKKFINYTFRGVSSKYMNNYLVYNNLVNYSLGTESQKINIMKNFTFSTKCARLYSDIPNRPLLPLLG